MQKCGVCGRGELNIVSGYSELPRVTSDGRPWPKGGKLGVCRACGAIQKIFSEMLESEIGDIYSSYNLWPMANGDEQKIFLENSINKPRSVFLVDFLSDNAGLPRTGKLLDIGCGTGAAISNFSSQYPEWRIFGADLSDRCMELLKKTPNFERLFLSPLSKIRDKFDMVLMIHSLEHFRKPREALEQTLKLMVDDGKILIQVPNIEENPFDLFIVDHYFHFSPANLLHLFSDIGMDVVEMRDGYLPKEITLLGMKCNSEGRKKFPLKKEYSTCAAYVENCIAWIKNVFEEAKKYAILAKNNKKQFGIFGTSISGMLLYGEIKEYINFFVDEDISRQGSYVNGIPIISPSDCPSGSIIYVPLIYKISKKIAEKHTSSDVKYIPTPEWHF
jgi:SAM-dependent methyltransferase